MREEDKVIVQFLDDEKCLNSLRSYSGLDKNNYNKERYNINRQEFLDRTKQYYIDNNDKIKAYQKIYNEENREKVLLRQRKYCQEHADKYRENSKKNYMLKKDELLQSRTCQCGSTYVLMGKNRHERTKKHQLWLIDQETTTETI